MGSAPLLGPSKGVGAPHQCSRVNKKRSGWGSLSRTYTTRRRIPKLGVFDPTPKKKQNKNTTTTPVNAPPRQKDIVRREGEQCKYICIDTPQHLVADLVVDGKHVGIVWIFVYIRWIERERERERERDIYICGVILHHDS